MKNNEIIQLFKEISKTIRDHKEELTRLDQDIGDSDHGINLARGFSVVDEKLVDLEGESIEAIIKAVSRALISNVGGASGILYGSFFQKMAPVALDKEEVSLPLYIEMLEAGVDAIKQRGRSDFGEKTMLDVLIPYLDYLKENKEKESTLLLSEATREAKKQLEATKDRQATKGRAAYLGERSIGHIDPGAMSAYLMIETVESYVKNYK